MALDFPSKPKDGDEYTDDCGSIWVYDSTDNKWTIQPADSPDGIWQITYADGDATISPYNASSILNMGVQNSDINFSDFPETT